MHNMYNTVECYSRFFSIVKKYIYIGAGDRGKNILFERIKEECVSVRRVRGVLFVYIYIYRFRSQGSEDGSRLSRNGWSITDSFGNSPPSQSRALHGSLCARRREEENEGQARTSLTRKYRQGSRFWRSSASRKSHHCAYEYVSRGIEMLSSQPNSLRFHLTFLSTTTNT